MKITSKQLDFLGMCAAREIKRFFSDPENVKKYEQSRHNPAMSDKLQRM